tara:strand:+ start:176 stop:895 length:720 start_codon:yes stop_codon:yes gene_type:complete
MLKTWGFVAAIVVVAGLALADEEKPSPSLKWEEAIQAFEKQDAENPVAPGGILFLGSSSIRMWDLGKWFPDMPVLNRGFGGSEIADSLYYFDRLVVPYGPKAIVFYAGDNDVAHGKTAEQVLDDYKAFAARVHEAFPEAKLLYVPIKPSLARWNLYPEMKKANDSIKAAIETDERETYIEIEGPMLDDKGKPKKDLLLEDGLHMTDGGYQIWTDLVKPQLTTMLAPKAESVEAAPPTSE